MHAVVHEDIAPAVEDVLALGCVGTVLDGVAHAWQSGMGCEPRIEVRPGQRLLNVHGEETWRLTRLGKV